MTQKGSTCNTQISVEKTRYGKDKYPLWKRSGYRYITEDVYTVEVWLLTTALPLIVIYLSNKFPFNLFCTFQDMAQTSIHIQKMVRENNSIHSGRIMFFMYCIPSHCLLPTYNISLKPFLFFPRYGLERHPLCKNGYGEITQ